MSRMACDKNMSVIIDDTIDVWRDSLPNLLLTRRFVGDPMDDGLQLLCHWLVQLHAGYYAALRPDGTPTLTTPEVLTDLRGNLLEGCVIAFTGLVADQSQEVLANQPLCALVRLYGAQVTLDVDDATHLVARKKEGWKSATKIRRALQRQEVQPPPPRPPRPPPPCLTLPSRLPVSPRHTQMQSTHPHYGFAQHPPYLGSFTPCACFVRSTPHPPPPLRQTDPSFRAVWDHWLLDSICTFKRQSEINYAVRLDEEEVEYIVPGRLDAAPAPMPPSIADDGPGCKSKGGATSGGGGGVARGRPRPSPLPASFFSSVFFSALASTGVRTLPLAIRRWREALFDSGRGLQDAGPTGLPAADARPARRRERAASSRRAGLARHLPIPSSRDLAVAQAPPGGGGGPPSACREPRQSSLICRRLSKIEDCTPRLSIDGLLGCC